MRNALVILKRQVSGFLAAALLFASASPGAAWQCIDGTPCAPNCRIAEHGGGGEKAGACCPATGSIQAERSSPCETSCRSLPCVVRFSATTDALLQPAFEIPDETAASLPANVAPAATI